MIEGFKKKILYCMSSFFILVMLLGAVIVLQQKIDSQNGQFKNIEEFSYLPSGKILRIAALEYREFAADILWLQAVQFVGGRDPSGQDYQWIYGVLDRVTEMDPRFSYAYQFGGIVLSVLSDNVEQSNQILKKGLRNRPDIWQIPFHLGYNYFYHLYDPLEAAKYMDIASKLEGHPEYLPLLTARLYATGNDPITALAFLEGMYRITKDERVREMIIRRMEAIQRGDTFSIHINPK